MPRAIRIANAAIGTLLVAVVATGVTAMQARAGNPAGAAPQSAVAGAAPAGPAAVPAPAPPARTTTAAAAADQSTYVRFPSRLAAGWGIDVSWPQCDRGMPAVATGFAILGVNGGRPFTDNPCLRAQIAATRGRLPLGVYLNLGTPGPGTSGVGDGDPAAYGRKVVDDGLARMARAGLRVPVVWLDVEIANAWSDRATNFAVITAALARLQQRGLVGGVYSSVPMWQQLTGGAHLDVPVWLAITGSEVPSLRTSCTTGLGGHKATMVQYVATAPNGELVDADVLCRTDPGVLKLFASH